MIEINNTETWSTLLEQAKKGDSEAQFEVACYFDEGWVVDDIIIVEKDNEKAYQWLLKAYENGNINATVRLADYLSEGKYCEKDVEKAKELYQIGIINGIGFSAINLATIYRDNNDFETAFKLYETAQQLDKTNLIQLAYCYHFGIGTKKDKIKAFNIFQNIASDNSEYANCEYDVEDANYFLGLYYLEGEIIEKSIDKAREYLKIANNDNDHRNAAELLLIIGKI